MIDKRANIDRIGEVGVNTFGHKMTIIDYISNKNMTVMFEDGYIKTGIWHLNFKNGNVRNPYDRTLHGVGYFGEGQYLSESGIDKKDIRYVTWTNMIKRCYSEKSLLASPQYIGCSVCEEWHNFQNFAKWFDNNYYTLDGYIMNLDKDILVKGNKIYSPTTCIFVPKEINILFLTRKDYRGSLPIGVGLNGNKFCATINKYGKSIHLGTFNTEIEAFNIYKYEREKYVKEVADMYKNIIPKILYDSMYNYIVEYTD